jgi:hypothetical protein
MYGNVSYQGTPPIGNNPGNVMAELMRRLMGGGMGGGPTQYGSPEGERAMAQMLGLKGAQDDPRMMAQAGGPAMGNSPMPAAGMQPPTMAGMQPPVPMSKPMGMGLGGGMGPDEEMRRRMMMARM